MAPGLPKYYFSMTRYVALVPAAGVGSRFGSESPKQYIPILGKPMLAHSVEALACHPRVDAVVVVLAPGDKWFQQFDWDVSDAKLQFHCVGGATRAESVRNGLLALEQDIGPDDWVLVHDAARPCLSKQLIDRLIGTIDDDAVGGLLAVRVSDTLKQADGGNRVGRTRARDGLWAAQTPQMFRRGLLERALNELDAGEVTDESSAIEALGLQPLLVESATENLKVTYAEDQELAEVILKGRTVCR